MLNLKKMLTKITTDFIVVGDNETSSSASVSANGGTQEFSIDMSKAGYKPIAVAGLLKNGGANAQIAISHWYFSGDTLKVSVVNNTSTARNISVTAKCVYVGGVVSRLLNAFATLFIRKGVAVC